MSYGKIAYFSFFLSLFYLSGYAQNPSCSAASKFYSLDSINVVTFGASTVAGVGGFSFQGYLQQDLQACYPGKIINITNNGVFGETTTQGLARFPAAIAGRTGFVIILMGADDALDLGKGIGKVSTTQANMRYFIEDKLLLVGLNQNYPNPANTSTTIGFSLSEAGHVQIKLYSMSGRFVKPLFDAYQNAGYTEVYANLTGLAAGVYVYTMVVGGQQLSKKLIIIK